MLNIDFKIAGSVVSVPLCINDTINSLLTRIKPLKQFEKYTSEQLQTKLVSNLKKIISTGNLQAHVIQKINNILQGQIAQEYQANQYGKFCKNSQLNILKDISLNASTHNTHNRLNHKQSKFNTNKIAYQIRQDNLQNRLRVDYLKMEKNHARVKQTQELYQHHYIRHYKHDQNIKSQIKAIQTDFENKRRKNVYQVEGHRQNNEQSINETKTLKNRSYTSSSCGYLSKNSYLANHYSQINQKQSIGKKSSIYIQEPFYSSDKFTSQIEPWKNNLENNSYVNQKRSIDKINRQKKFSYL